VLLATALVMPVMTLALVWTNDWHHLVYQNFEVFTRGGLRMFEATRGPCFTSISVTRRCSAWAAR